jgi:outer membrane lipoprotein-sorting protein
MRKIFKAAIAAVIAITVALPAAAETVDFEALLKQVDAATTFKNQDFSAVFTIVTDKPGKKQQVSQIRMFRRDAKDQSLILIQLPEADKGQGYLMDGDNLQFYDPTSRKFNHTSMKDALGDSEAQNGDLKKNSTLDDYKIQATSEGTLGKIPVWIIELKAKSSDVSYDQLRLYVRKDKPLTLKQEFLSLNGRLMRTIFYPKYAEVAAGKYFPSQMLVVDEINKGEKSQMTMSEISIDPLPDKVFTKAFLEQTN